MRSQTPAVLCIGGGGGKAHTQRMQATNSTFLPRANEQLSQEQIGMQNVCTIHSKHWFKAWGARRRGSYFKNIFVSMEGHGDNRGNKTNKTISPIVAQQAIMLV